MKDLAQFVIDNMLIGRAMLAADAGALLMDCVAKSTGDYIEIGSGVGGSALMAAMAMEKADKSGTVYCIDPFSGATNLDGRDGMLHAFWKNVLNLGLEQRIIVFRQHHPPFPEALYYHKFSVGLIDGDQPALLWRPSTPARQPAP